MVKWLERRACNQLDLGSKPTCAILFCPWRRHFTAHSPAWWSWQAVLNFSHISIKLQADSNILASPEAGRGNCLPYVLGLRRFPASQEAKYRDKKSENACPLVKLNTDGKILDQYSLAFSSSAQSIIVNLFKSGCKAYHLRIKCALVMQKKIC